MITIHDYFLVLILQLDYIWGKVAVCFKLKSSFANTDSANSKCFGLGKPV
jgi:hypothetical protein